MNKFCRDIKKNLNFSSQKGYTLVELLVTIVIIATSFTAFAVALSTGALAVSEDDNEVTAQSLARSQLEYIKYIDYDQDAATYPAITVPEDYSITVSVAAVPGADEKIQKITVNIYKDGTLLMTVEDYKVDR